MHIVTVSQSVRRYNEGGVEALLKDKTRKPGKELISTETKNEFCRIVCLEKPENATHWSTLELAKRVALSHNAVSLVLKERGLKFDEITTKHIRRGSWEGVVQLEKAIGEYIKHWNKTGRRFTWTRTTKEINSAISEAKSGYAL